MTKLLLSIHVLAAIVAIGPVTVAASMFPAATRRALFDPEDPRGVAVLRNLHRICRVYAALGVLVPVFGLATASALGVLGDAWLIISMILTAAAAAVLAFLVLPGQAAVLAGLAAEPNPPATAAGIPAPSPDSTSRARATDTGEAIPASVPTPPPGRALPSRVPAPEPGQVIPARVIAGRAVARLGMVTGVFNLLWAVVVVLMIVRPGSTTGA